MKKKFSLLVVFLCLFSMSSTLVQATEECGWRYFSSYGGYVKYYRNSWAPTLCYPGSASLAAARGIKGDNGWNTIASSVTCDVNSGCKYQYKGKNYEAVCIGSAIYKASSTNKSTTLQTKFSQNGYHCINSWFDTPAGSGAFKTVTKEEGQCLKRKKGGGYTMFSKGSKYSIGDYGYEVVEIEKCNKNTDSSNPSNPSNPSTPSNPSSGNGCQDNNLYQTCRGTNVKNLQIKLEAVQKCGIEIDGSYGPSTKSCVIAFQKASGLNADGYAGSKTISALDAAYTKLQKENSDKTAQEGKFLKVYNITYDTNGGTFANGETKRAVYYIENESTIAPATIPGKKGYKFVGWYNGSEKYVFGNKLSGNINLTAKYEKSSTTKYCLEGDILDIDNNQCITLQEFSNEDAIKFYMTGNNKKQTIQTIFNATRSCPNNVYTVTEKDAVGSNNTVVCDGDNGYMRDTWRAAWNCYDDTQCPLSGSADCNETFRGTCYAAYSPGDTALAEEPDSDSKTKYTQTIKNNATESPQTGGGIIALILVTLSIVGLAIYCYNVYNKKSEEV